MKHIQMIAEIGCNHNGSAELALEMVRAARRCGADAVKFQSFHAEQLVSAGAEKAAYQKRETGSTESQREMLRKLELSPVDYLAIKREAEALGLCVFSTPFDLMSVEFLQQTGQTVWKIPSGELNDLPLLEAVAGVECPDKEILLSTGMATMEEIRQAAGILGKSRNTVFTVLHCNTAYPTRDEDMNLLVLTRLAREFPGWHIGLSDHSVGITAAMVAAGLGATVIEKHFTLDKALPGPDHKASATPEELTALCSALRRAEIMLGSGEKQITLSERENREAARKSIVARCAIAAGERFTEDNLTCKRPGGGLSPMQWHAVLGRTAERDFAPEERITEKGLTWENE